MTQDHPTGPDEPCDLAAGEETDLSAFARKLKEFREARSLSQSDLARRASLNSSYLSRLERAVDRHRSPRLSTIRQLAEALDLSSAETRLFYELARPSSLADVPSVSEGPVFFEFGREGVNKFDPGEGYVLIRVDRPNGSQQVASSLVRQFPDEVRCAAAVFGRYDVVAWLRTKSYRDLVHIIDSLHSTEEFRSVRYTQTILVRWDEPYLESSPEYNGMQRMAFVFLRKQKGLASKFMRKIGDISVSNAEIMHASVITGAYDTALTIRYVDSRSLENLVVELQNIQEPSLSECVAVPCLSNMIYLGRGLRWLQESWIENTSRT